MSPIGTNSIASQVYSGVQRGNTGDTARAAATSVQPANRQAAGNSFTLPNKATPRGDWVLSENANPQDFETGAPRGSYLNVVV